MNWTVALTAFGGGLVEFIEAAIIVVAAAAMADWRSAFGGTLAAMAILAAAVAALGLTLLHLVPIAVLRAVVGGLLLLFGVKWLSKATVRLGTPRRAGHHEAEGEGGRAAAFAMAFNGVLLEGAEVVFIVLALGATGRAMGSAVIGASVAGALCVVGAVAARRPLAAVPDVVLKYIIGIMLTSFGTLWVGEALGIPWWGSDASVAWLAAGNLVVTLVTVAAFRRGGAAAVRSVAGGPAPEAEDGEAVTG